jgi:hypothetical protein
MRSDYFVEARHVFSLKQLRTPWKIAVHLENGELWMILEANSQKAIGKKCPTCDPTDKHKYRNSFHAAVN